MSNKQEIIVKIDNDEWKEALDKSFKKNVKDKKIKGFREGKAPRDIYEKNFGIESLYKDAVDFIIPNAYKKLLNDNNIIPAVQPSIDIKSIDKEGIEILFKIITKPEIKIKKYKDLKVDKPKLIVTNEEITKEIENLRQKYAEIIIKDGKIETGDTAVIDFQGSKEGKPFEGGKGENYPLEIGSNTFIPGFEDKLIGLKTGDEKEINLTFPKDYPSDELKGQEVMFKVKINEVKTKETPELDEDFFKDLDMKDVTNKEELHKFIKEEITNRKEEENENIYVDNILVKIAENVEVDIPDEMVNEEINYMINQYEEKLKIQGITLDQYLKFTGDSREKFEEKFKEEAKKVITYRLMIEEIAKKENLKITDKDAQEEVKNMSKKYQMEEDEFLKAMGGLDMIKYDMLMRKTVDLLKESN